jgi:hypothetical protein
VTTDLVLPQVPALGGLYARSLVRAASLAAARRTGNAPTGLPDVALEVDDVPVDTQRLAGYQSLLGLRAADRLPAGFVHTMVFPLQVALMARSDFPLAPAGMVHVANRVTQRHPLWREDRLDLRVPTVDLRPHRSGTQLDFVSEVRRAGSSDVAWEAVSTYLARGARLPAPAAPSLASEQTDALGTTSSDASGPRGVASEQSGVGGSHSSDVADWVDEERAMWVPPVPTASWRLPADTGRRYAAVSGDRNPVHLSALTARPFGFKRAIAHGMYTAARALADVGPAAGHTFVWTADFAKPLLLPATVSVRIAPEGNGFGYAVWQQGGSRPYLTGAVTPLPS